MGATVVVVVEVLVLLGATAVLAPPVLACWTGAVGSEGRKILVTWLICSGRLIFAGVIGGPASVREAEASKAASVSFVFMATCRIELCWIGMESYPDNNSALV